MSGPSFESIFKGKQDRLENTLDLDHGLLSTLEAKGVITKNHRTAIEVTFIL